MPAIAILAITIDLDDTLWPIGPAIVRAEQRTHDWLLENVPSVAANWPIPRLKELRMSLYQSRVELRHDFRHLRRLALRHAFGECGIDADSAAASIEASLDVFMRARNDVEPYPEVVACLERLSQRYRLASLTNGNADLAVIGLDHLFHTQVSAHVHGTSKPDPALFHLACRALDCAPHEVVHVGDDTELDVRGARKAGLHAVWINRDGKSWPGEDVPVTVSNLLELEHWLEYGDSPNATPVRTSATF
ncbi:MAG: HAD family hydrolase [Betaproteobacteria bacterium]|nr:HAD family hydrolase [Betaproteobacteria bacterium]